MARTVWQRFGTVQQFGYGPDLQRFVQQAGAKTTIYLDRSYEQVRGGAARFQIDEDVLVRLEPGSAPQVHYQHRNRLGSIVAVTDSTGQLLADTERGYDPWGRPRDENWVATDTLPGADITPRGFTDHEHIDGSRLIHMNGRAFDPLLGRFLSVDPVIQFPANSQSLNPYSYIMNNPMAGTDPTGYRVACNVTKTECSFAGDDIASATADENGVITGTLNNGMQVVVTSQVVSNGQVVNVTTTDTEGSASPDKTGEASQRVNIDEKASAKGVRNFAIDRFCDVACEMSRNREEQSDIVASATETLSAMGDEIDPLNPVNIATAAGGPVVKAGTMAGRFFRFLKNIFRRGDSVDDVARGVDPNKLKHIFGQERHNLGGVVKQFGSEEKAFNAIQQATETAVRSQGLKGVFETTVKVGTESITVRGKVIDESIKIGTAFVP